MEARYNLPDPDRLSIVSAIILLAYAMIPFVNLPIQPVRIELPFVFFQFGLDFGTLVSLFVALLAGLGTDWLLQSHPKRERQSLLRHGFIPALTAWVISVPLNTIEVGLQWWAVLALGGALLVLVLVAEYIVVDLSGLAYVPASLGLTAISFALYLILTISMRAGGFRLFLLMPALVPALFLLVLRSLYLRSSGEWLWGWAAGIALFVGQLAIGLHYLPVQPLSFGLILVGAAYALTAWAAGLKEGREGASLWAEPVFLLVVLWTIALLAGG